MLSFLLLSVTSFVYGAEPNQNYVEIEIGDTIEKETAYVVAPHIIITVPRSHDILLLTINGTYKGEEVWWFSYNVIDSVKCYISYNAQEVSKDIPEKVRTAYEKLRPLIEDMGGIDRILNMEIDEDKERATA